MRDATPLWRQVNPHWVRDGRVTSQAFKPTKKDENRLSVDNGDLISAEEAHRTFSEHNSSAGVLAVLVGECEGQRLEVLPDPVEGRESHTLIDFGGLSRGGVRKAAEHLRNAAEERGWQYQPPSP